jgi:hypothetical protein
MKTLRESILDDLDTQIKRGDKVFKDEINAFLKENFKGASSCKISRNPNSDGLYEVSSSKDIETKNITITSLTNGMFIWDKVDGIFNITACLSLKSLEGAPKEVGERFTCFGCDSLESLEGAPEKVDGDFYCGFNNSLTSLKGAPKEVGGDFRFLNCKVKFTKDDVKKVSNVKGKIIC